MTRTLLPSVEIRDIIEISSHQPRRRNLPNTEPDPGAVRRPCHERYRKCGRTVSRHRVAPGRFSSAGTQYDQSDYRRLRHEPLAYLIHRRLLRDRHLGGPATHITSAD